MELEQTVCTYEQAKRLFELGINQSLLFVWCDTLLGTEEDSEKRVPKTILFYSAVVEGEIVAASAMPDVWDREDYEIKEMYPAFTVAELGVMLPPSSTFKTPDGEWAAGSTEGGTTWHYPTEAEARAAFLIQLLEGGLTTAEKVNARLAA